LLAFALTDKYRNYNIYVKTPLDLFDEVDIIIVKAIADSFDPFFCEAFFADHGA